MGYEQFNMNPPSLRIFITTSHISTAYMTLLVKNLPGAGSDVLLVDTGKRRNEKLDHIHATAAHHVWSLVHNFSESAPEIHDLNPGLKKRLTRRFKNFPVLRKVYSALLERKMAKTDSFYRTKLSEILKPFISSDQKVEIYAMTGTYLNRPVTQIFPAAKLIYVEHGIGDYYYSIVNGKPLGEMYAVFAAPFRSHLENLHLNSGWVHQLPGLEKFPEFSRQLLLEQNFTSEISTEGKKIILILLEAVDMYEVPESFWRDYLDHIFAQIKNPEDYFFLLKPHHLQSEISIKHTRNHIDKLGFSYTIILDERLKSAAIEVLFAQWENKIEHVFFAFSSAGFYLSVLYPLPHIQYHFSTAFMARYVKNAPEQFRTLFNDIRPLMEKVFSGNCKEY